MVWSSAPHITSVRCRMPPTFAVRSTDASARQARAKSKSESDAGRGLKGCATTRTRADWRRNDPSLSGISVTCRPASRLRIARAPRPLTAASQANALAREPPSDSSCMRICRLCAHCWYICASASGHASASCVFTGSPATTSIALNASDLLRFVPAANYNCSATALSANLIESGLAIISGATINLTGATGGSTHISSGTVALSETVNAVNDAPIASGSATLAAINEDAASPPGATVSSLFSGNFSDATDQVIGGSSANTFAGIAPESVPAFMVAQCLGAVVALGALRVLWPSERLRTSAAEAVVPHTAIESGVSDD